MTFLLGGKEQKLSFPFVKAHCGWDCVLLVLIDKLPSGITEKDVVKKLFHPQVFVGLEVGFLYSMSNEGEENKVRLRIIDSTTRDWLAMCGGMSQALGKCLIECENFKNPLKLKVSEPTTKINLVCDECVVPLISTVESNTVTRVYTDMLDYFNFLKDGLIKKMEIEGIPFLRVGYFFVFNVEKLVEKFQGVDFGDTDNVEHEKIMCRLVKSALKAESLKDDCVYAMMYDRKGHMNEGNFRIFSRFYKEGKLVFPFNHEFQCGTGTIACLIGILLSSLKNEFEKKGKYELKFEFGSKITSERNPFGQMMSYVDLDVADEGKVEKVLYSHNVIEILEEGTLHVPRYDTDFVCDYDVKMRHRKESEK